MSAEIREKLRDVLRDENNLPPTEASTDVLIAVLFAMDRIDKKWGDRDYPGAPSVNDYAVGVMNFLERRYDLGRYLK